MGAYLENSVEWVAVEHLSQEPVMPSLSLHFDTEEESSLHAQWPVQLEWLHISMFYSYANKVEAFK